MGRGTSRDQGSVVGDWAVGSEDAGDFGCGGVVSCTTLCFGED